MFRPEVLVARIAPGLQMASSLVKIVLLDVHALEHRLDHQVDIRERLP